LKATELGIVFSIYTYSYTIMQIRVDSLLDRCGMKIMSAGLLTAISWLIATLSGIVVG
jgi:MFS transporter, ACS family, D-galactonate transporter